MGCGRKYLPMIVEINICGTLQMSLKEITGGLFKSEKINSISEKLLGIDKHITMAIKSREREDEQVD